jgi:hypothetical protein
MIRAVAKEKEPVILLVVFNIKKPDRINNVYPVRLHMKAGDELALALP